MFLDLPQLIRFILLTLATAPPNYHWQQFLERMFPAYPPIQGARGKEDTELKAMEAGQAQPQPQAAAAPPPSQALDQPQFSLRNTLTKWFVDCITAGAIMNTIAFLVLMGIMKGQAGSQIWLNIKNVSYSLQPQESYTLQSN